MKRLDACNKKLCFFQFLKLKILNPILFGVSGVPFFFFGGGRGGVGGGGWGSGRSQKCAKNVFSKLRMA